MSVRDNEAEGEIRRLEADVARLTAALAEAERERDLWHERCVASVDAGTEKHVEMVAVARERDGLRAALAVETSNANAYAHERDAALARAARLERVARDIVARAGDTWRSKPPDARPWWYVQLDAVLDPAPPSAGGEGRPVADLIEALRDAERPCLDAVHQWGVASQVGMFHEEVGELLAAINRFDRKRATLDNVAEEVADVLIVTLQLARVFGVGIVARHVARKIDRLRGLLATPEPPR